MTEENFGNYAQVREYVRDELMKQNIVMLEPFGDKEAVYGIDISRIPIDTADEKLDQLIARRKK